MTKVYSVWYRNVKGECCMYANNILSMEEARKDLQTVIEKYSVTEGWIKQLEETVVVRDFPAVDPMAPAFDMTESEAKIAVMKLQNVVYSAVIKIPADYAMSHTYENIPEALLFYATETAVQKLRREQLEEEVARLRKVVSEVAKNLGNSSTVSEEASIEFIEDLPREVKLVVEGLNNKCERISNNLTRQLQIKNDNA